VTTDWKSVLVSRAKSVQSTAHIHVAYRTVLQIKQDRPGFRHGPYVALPGIAMNDIASVVEG
jgi:hypothetical protein